MEFNKAYEAIKNGKTVTRKDAKKWKNRGLALQDSVLYEVWDTGSKYPDIVLPLEDIAATDWEIIKFEEGSNTVIYKNQKLTVNGAEVNRPYCMEVISYERTGIAKVRLTLTTDLQNVKEWIEQEQ